MDAVRNERPRAVVNGNERRIDYNSRAIPDDSPFFFSLDSVSCLGILSKLCENDGEPVIVHEKRRTTKR